MNTKNIRSSAIAVVSGLVMLGIMPLAAMAATPTITSVVPSSTVVGGSAFTMTVNGNNFDSNAVVNINGSARPTTYVSSTQLTAQIPATDIAATSNLNVSVTNPSAGGGISAVQTFTVGNVAPSTTSISSSVVPAGNGAFTLTVNGSNFLPGSVVQFNGSARATTYVSPTQLTAAITAADLLTPGSFNVAVVNPAPGGGTSNAQVLTVAGNNPVPTLTSISPTSKVVGSGSFVMTVTGTNFTPTSVVRYNGLARTTTYVSPTQLTAVIPASDVSLTGGYFVNVVNSTPGGGASNFLLFTVAPSTTTPVLPDTGFGPGASAANWPLAAAVTLATAILGIVVSRMIAAKE